MKNLKSSIVVKRRVIYTDGGNVKRVEKSSQLPSIPTKISKKCSENLKSFTQASTNFKPSKNLWKNVPSAIRYARCPSEISDSGKQDLEVDEKLDEMCYKAFVSGELPNKAYTLEEIGSYCGISRERVRQIEVQALNNLRSHIKAQFGWEMDLKDLIKDTPDTYTWRR
jgi:DNA-directed RNA polymerase sigma subunit (sigma70/sigma32)